MKIFIPDNLFTGLIKKTLVSIDASSMMFKPSSLLARELTSDENAVALIPTTDLLLHNDLFVSGSFGISFEGSLCNSYIYFNSQKNDLDKIYITGDVSSVETVLTKIIFKEIYNLNVEINLADKIIDMGRSNVLMVGNDNFINQQIDKGLSFSDEVIEILSLPFVNYVLASKNEKNIKEIIPHLAEISLSVYDKIEKGEFGVDVSITAEEYIKKNISSLILNFDENDLDGISQLLRLPFYHGIIENIVDVKFV